MMSFQLKPAIGKIPVFLLLFLNSQIMQGAVTISLMAIALRLTAFDRALASELPVAQNPRSSQSICPAGLGTAIDAVIARPQLGRAHWGILIEPLSIGERSRVLYSHNADRYFIPASNAKLLTTAAALHQLGPSFRIRTSVYDAGAGSLRVVGRGDPSLTGAQLKELAQQLKRQGFREIQQLLVDDGYFQGDVVNPNWEWEDVQSYYGTPVNSLILNQNAVDLTLSPQQPGQPLRMSWTDAIAARQWQIENDSITAEAGAPQSVTVAAVLGKPMLQIKGRLAANAQPESFGLAILDPARYFLQHFRNVLALEGINVQRAAVVLNGATVGERELAAVESPPLSVLLAQVNQKSNNLYAEVLLRTLGMSGKRSPSTNTNSDSAELGLNQFKATLTELGVGPEGYVSADGSGLSRHNLVTPEAIVQTLKFMAATPQASVYRSSLPTAGVTGTLRNRFRNTAAQGNVQAKTGSMTGVSSLSGYLDVPGYQPLVFSILVNQSDQSASTLRNAIDEIVLLLTRLRSC
jgi:serine-type D-Ala-D-Ala carboxypeptidase/endopeptidase (penicillin-binding protein 4)